MKLAHAGLLIGLVLLAGCETSGPATTAPVVKPQPGPDPLPAHVPGDVIVSFNEGVTEAQADAMFAAHAVEWESSFSHLFAYWVEVLSGDPSDLADRLAASPLVLWAQQRGNPFGTPGAVYLIVEFNPTATDATAQALIDSFPELRVQAKTFPTGWGVAHVAPGQELHWIGVFEQEPIVAHAELNYIFKLD